MYTAKFLTITHNFNNSPYDYSMDSLIYMWQRNLQLKNLPPLEEVRLTFKTWSFNNYPDQAIAKELVDRTYGHRKRKKSKVAECYYWCGTKYDMLEDIYNALSEQKLFAELTVEGDFDKEYFFTTC